MNIQSILVKLGLLAAICILITIGSASVSAGPQVKQFGGAVSMEAMEQPNDTCATAEELEILLVIGQEAPTETFMVAANNRKFYNGNNTDDWFSYTTHDPGCTVELFAELTCDKTWLELEVYEECFMRPADSSWFAQDEPIELGEDEFDPGNSLSEYHKIVRVNEVEPNHTYYFHVNVIAWPEGYPIEYDLRITEQCVMVPRSGELPTGRQIRIQN